VTGSRSDNVSASKAKIGMRWFIDRFLLREQHRSEILECRPVEVKSPESYRVGFLWESQAVSIPGYLGTSQFDSYPVAAAD
jgi:hypothetical protein